MQKILRNSSNRIAMFKNILIIKISFLFLFLNCLKRIDIPEEYIKISEFLLLSYPDLELKTEQNSIIEGQNQKILIKLKTQPLGEVRIPISTTNSLLKTNISSIFFTQENWDSFQEIQLQAPEDPYYEPTQKIEVSLGPAESSDFFYNGKINSLSYLYTNNEPLGFSMSYSNLWEGGGSVPLSISLLSQPRSNVTVTILNPNSSEFTLSSSSVVFTTSNWNVPQNITLTAVDDTELEYDQTYTLTFLASSSDSYYNEYKQEISITVYDNDVPGFQFSSGFSIIEGGSQNVGIRLLTPPTSLVTVNLTSSPTANCTISSGSSLSFDNTNYNTYQYFTIQAKAADNIDNLGETFYNCTITATASSSDPLYNNLTSNLYGYINDFVNGSLIINNGGSTILSTLNESGTNTTFTLRLNSQPTGTVKVCIKSDNYCEAFIESTGINPPDGSCSSYAGANTPYVIFNSTNWNIDKTISVKARHDWDFRNPGSIPEVGGKCNPPFPDSTKSYNILFYTICPVCNTGEAPYYNTGTSPYGITLSGSVSDDLDYYSFVTSSTHNGDFANDASLSGSNAIQKADNFCSQNLPSGFSGTFKALLVDGINRQAAPVKINWILKQNKYYFRQDGTTLMFKTDSNEYFIFGDPDANGAPSGKSYWTGLIGATWFTNANTCSGWTSSLSTNLGQAGSGGYTNSYSIDSTFPVGCDSTVKRLLCIQQ